MKPAEMKYALVCFGFFALSICSFLFLHSVVLGILLAILGIFFGIRSTSTKNPKWGKGVLIAIVAIILGYVVAALFLGSITG